MTEMFDVADAFCRAERLLSWPAPRTAHAPEWLLTEIVGQLGGANAPPWDDAGHPHQAVDSQAG